MGDACLFKAVQTMKILFSSSIVVITLGGMRTRYTAVIATMAGKEAHAVGEAAPKAMIRTQQDSSGKSKLSIAPAALALGLFD
jgi:hypothetical protein